MTSDATRCFLSGMDDTSCSNRWLICRLQTTAKLIAYPINWCAAGPTKLPKPRFESWRKAPRPARKRARTGRGALEERTRGWGILRMVDQAPEVKFRCEITLCTGLNPGRALQRQARSEASFCCSASTTLNRMGRSTRRARPDQNRPRRGHR